MLRRLGIGAIEIEYMLPSAFVVGYSYNLLEGIPMNKQTITVDMTNLDVVGQMLTLLNDVTEYGGPHVRVMVSNRMKQIVDQEPCKERLGAAFGMFTSKELLMLAAAGLSYVRDADEFRSQDGSLVIKGDVVRDNNIEQVQQWIDWQKGGGITWANES